VLTGGGNLKAKYVITRRPEIFGITQGTLNFCRALIVTASHYYQNKISSIAFLPSHRDLWISCGGGFPNCLKNGQGLFEKHSEIKLVRFVLFDSKTFEFIKIVEGNGTTLDEINFSFSG